MKPLIPSLVSGLILGLAPAWGAKGKPKPCRDELFDAPFAFTKLPSLASGMAERLGISKPPRMKPVALPPLKYADSLSRAALSVLMGAMSRKQNWSDVAYAASGHRTVEDKLRASWLRDDAVADVREYFARLTPAQIEIANAAFTGGMAEIPGGAATPDEITLEWVKENYPARAGF